MNPTASPVVLIHGLIGTLNDPRLLGPLEPALAPDLLGYGALSDTPGDRVTLEGQVEHLHRLLSGGSAPTYHLVGHSVGGAIAVLFAERYPKLVASITSVEGNFTLADAFWTSRVARMSRLEVEQLLEGFRSDPAGWLRRSGIVPEESTLATARRWLANQPASTVQATASSVVAITSRPQFLEAVRSVLERAIPFHLVAGERSRAEWHVPDWVVARAQGIQVIPATGHLMMLEAPHAFADAISWLVRGGPSSSEQ